MIKNINIKNFKSLKEINFELPQFAVIVGNNGAGKTNLLTAVKLVSLLSDGKQINDVLKLLTVWPSEFFFDPNTPKAEFIFDMLIKGKSVKYLFELLRNPPENGFAIGKEELIVNKETILHREGTSPVRLRQNDGSYIDSQPIVNNLLALSVLPSNQLVYEIKQWLSKIIVDTFEPNVLKNYGTPPKDNTSLTGALAEKLYYLQSSEPEVFKEIVVAFRKIIPGLENVDVEMMANEGLILKFKETSVEKEYHSFSASNGNLRAMGITSALYGKPKLSAIFIDEIENSLHPSRIKSVLNLLKYLAEDESERLQVIMTTHNPVLLDYFTPEEIVYCFKKKGVTSFVNPYKNKSVMYHLQEIKDQKISLRELFTTGLLEDIFATDEQ